jgi:hypothetical protein
VSFAGCGYRVGNRYRGQTVGVRVVGDTVQITLATHCSEPTVFATTRSRSSVP